MADKRIVVEHRDGRRLSVLEADFDVAERNPFNDGADIHEFDGNTGETIMRRRQARPMDDWTSLKKEGFRAVMMIDPETGHEVPLED